MSRGSGRLQRRVLHLLETAPEHNMNREQLDQVLVETEKYDASNVLRSIKSLARKHLVAFTDQRHKKDSTVSLPRKVKHLTDDELADLLAELRGGK